MTVSLRSCVFILRSALSGARRVQQSPGRTIHPRNPQIRIYSLRFKLILALEWSADTSYRSYSFNGPNNPAGPHVYQPVYPFPPQTPIHVQAQQQQQQQQPQPLHGQPYPGLNAFNSPYHTPPSFQPQQYPTNPYSHPHYHQQQPPLPPVFYPTSFPHPQPYPPPPHFYGIPPTQSPVPYQLQATAPRFYPSASPAPRPGLTPTGSGNNIAARPFVSQPFSQPQPVNDALFASPRVASPAEPAPASFHQPRLHQPSFVEEPVLPRSASSSTHLPLPEAVPATSPPPPARPSPSTSQSNEPPAQVERPAIPIAQILSPPRSPSSPSSSVGTGFSPSSARYHILSCHPIDAIQSGDATVSLFISQLSSPPTDIRDAAIPLPGSKPQKMAGPLTRKVRERKTPPTASATGRYVGPAPTPTATKHTSVARDYHTPTSENLPSAALPLRDAPDSSTDSSTTPATSMIDTPTPGSPLSSNTSASSVAHQERTIEHTDNASESTTHAVPNQSTSGAAVPTVDEPVNDAKKATKPIPLTKSFASLLRSSTAGSRPPSAHVNNAHISRSLTPAEDATSDAAPGGGGPPFRSAILPSAQIGFSVPAISGDTKEKSLAASLSPRQHASLLKLLKTGSGLPPSSSTSTPKASPSSNSVQIIPRGLVNTGNLCFANAVLQSLVYTPPFWKLFEELGKSGLRTDSTSGKETSMIDAVVAFLNEFKPKVGPGPIDATSFPTASAAASLGSGTSTPNAKQPSASNSRDPTLLPRNSFTASHLYNSLKSNSRFDAMRSGHQEDAEEFLGFYLDGLHEELCALLSLLGDSFEGGDAVGHDSGWGEGSESSAGQEGTPDTDDWQEVGKKNRAMVTRTMKSAESAITGIFGGKFRSVLRASGRPDSASVEEWRCLQLDIQPQHVRTIEDALHAISAIETVSIQNKHGISTEATKQMFVEQLPPILVLHLKRFVYDPVTGIGKNGKAIKFGPELEIRSDLMSPSLKHGKGPCRYKLYGVIYHHGLAASGGHYTLDVLHPGLVPSADMKDTTPKSNSSTVNPSTPPPASVTEETWVRFDDESVRRLTREDVFGHPGTGVNSSRRGEREDRAAYLLLYRRIGR